MDETFNISSIEGIFPEGPDSAGAYLIQTNSESLMRVIKELSFDESGDPTIVDIGKLDPMTDSKVIAFYLLKE